MRPVSRALSALTVVAACGGAGGDATESTSPDGGSAQPANTNQFERGFPVVDTPSRVYDASDLSAHPLRRLVLSRIRATGGYIESRTVTSACNAARAESSVARRP